MGRYHETNRARTRLGALVASVVAGAWRDSAPPLELSQDELQEVTPLLLETGAGGLGWRRVRQGSSATSDAGRQLQQAYRLHTLQVALHESQLIEAVEGLLQVGIEPLVAKGWAVGRLYPEKGLRPYGDLDLAVPPHQYAQALEALRSPGAPSVPVDLHPGWPYLDDRSGEEQYRRSQVLCLQGHDIRVLGAEDHLRLLCLHMLTEGCWRPGWLCDLGVSLDALPPEFDWDYFLSGSRRRTEWALCALGLAHRLVGATLLGTPVAERAAQVPDWLVQETLLRLGLGHPPYGTRMRSTLTERQGVLAALRQRWPGPIQVGLRWRSPRSRLPLLPFQLWDYGLRGVLFLSRLAKGTKATR